ncbi:unnamed protein product, partial [marine sediment metagenome]
MLKAIEDLGVIVTMGDIIRNETRMEKILIVGPASQILGIKIAQELNIRYFNTESKTFPDGENYLRINVDNESLIEGKEIIIVQSTGPSSSEN